MAADLGLVEKFRRAVTAHRVLAALFGLWMTLAALAYLTAPAMARAFAHLGFPTSLRIELAIAKLLGVAVLLAPSPERMKEWAYAGFGVTLVSAIVAHVSVDGPAAAGPPLAALVLLIATYATRGGSGPRRASSIGEGNGGAG